MGNPFLNDEEGSPLDAIPVSWSQVFQTSHLSEIKDARLRKIAALANDGVLLLHAREIVVSTNDPEHEMEMIPLSEAAWEGCLMVSIAWLEKEGRIEECSQNNG